MKYIAFDSSTLISLSSSCLFNAVGKMFNELRVQGVISRGVELESIIHPIKVKRFELSATRIKHGFDRGWLKRVKLNKAEKSDSKKLMKKANNCFQTKRGFLNLLQRGEVEALVLAKKLGATTVAVDERTTRMLIEEPSKLKDLMERRQKTSIKKDTEKINELKKIFSNINFVRSSELIALASEKGFLQEEIGKGKKALEAALYSLKFNGCALSSSEIKKYLN